MRLSGHSWRFKEESIKRESSSACEAEEQSRTSAGCGRVCGVLVEH